MAISLSKPILQHSRAGKGGGSMRGGEVSTAPETPAGSISHVERQQIRNLHAGQTEAARWVEDTPNSIGTPQSHHQVPNNLSQQGCFTVFKLLPFLVPGLHWAAVSVSPANRSMELSQYQDYQHFKEQLGF